MGFESERLASTRTLPPSYTAIWGLDLLKDQRAAVLLNVAALPLFALSGWIFSLIASTFKPEIIHKLYIVQLAAQSLGFFLALVGTIVGIVLVHEAIHGIFFWIYTRSRPVFGLKLLFAYAGAPAWYIPRDQYAIIGLAPLIIITVAGLVLTPFLSLPIGQLTLLVITVNAAGAVGDLYVVSKTLCQSRDVLVCDTGVGFTMFGEVKSSVAMKGQNVDGVSAHE